MFILGCIFSFFITYLMVDMTHTNQPTTLNVDKFKREVENMMLFGAICETMIFFLIIFFFRAMYVNKYGVADTVKDNLSDLDDISNQDVEINQPPSELAELDDGKKTA